MFKKVKNVVVRIISIIFFAVFLLAGIFVRPYTTAAVLLLGAVILFPLKKWRTFLKDKLKIFGITKVVVLVIIVYAAIMVAPAGDMEDTPTQSISATPTPIPTITATLEPTPTVTITPTPTLEPGLLESLKEHGYSSDQISTMLELLSNVGITDIKKTEYESINGLQTISGCLCKVDGKEVWVTIIVNDGVIDYVRVECPDRKPYLSGLTNAEAELYFALDGGYLKKIDWEKKSVVDFTAEELNAIAPTQSDLIGESKSNPYKITAEELASEILSDKQLAGKKYNGKWIEITGKISYISDVGDMKGYYVYGKSARLGDYDLSIMCWCEDQDVLSTGSTHTFLGIMREVTTFNVTEIAECDIIA